MALRTRYGYNCQKINFGNLFQLVPLGHMEVVPGETLSGSIAINLHSAPLTKEITTRVYADAYAFYTPFRIMWSDWPEFISGQNAALVPPMVSDIWAFNFENRFTVPNAGGTAYDRNVAFMRRAYNYAFLKFFFPHDTTATFNMDTGTIQYAYMRPSTMETAALDATHGPVTAASLAVEDLRTAFATDAFQKMRRYYGDRYVDYLAAVGVKADFNLLEEPELLGQKHTDWKFRRATAAFTGTAPSPVLGQTAGYFASGVNLPIKRTFIPEHGLVSVFCVARADMVMNATPVCSVSNKRTREDYWQPELQGVRTKSWDAQQFVNVDGTPGAATPWSYPQFQEYRMGQNEYGQGPLTGNFSLTQDTSAKAKNFEYYRLSQIAANWADNFNQTVLSGQNYQATAQYRLIRQSPVRRVDVRLKVT